VTRYGYFLSCEEYPPAELVRQARLAEQAGFDGLWISDHFHPWLDKQGEAAFVWTVIGAIAQTTSLPITTAVTCPLVRVDRRSSPGPPPRRVHVRDARRGHGADVPRVRRR
jgi:Luciferase-like monooxygenase